MDEHHLSAVPDDGGVRHCYRHAGRETWIRCQRCDRPICPDCMRDAAVGFQCPECVSRGSKETRQGQALYGGKRSGDPRLTTFVLIGINALVWLAITATGGSRSRLLDALALAPRGRCTSEADPGIWYPTVADETTCNVATGADGVWHPGVADGAWWQVVTSAFTHVEIWHIAMNMFALFLLGPMLEQVLGRARFLAVYAISGLTGSAAVLWMSDVQSTTVGASGAIFGLLGALLVTFTKSRRNTQWLVQNLVLVTVITVVGWQHISWQGHLGGFLGGAAAAAVVAFAPKQSRTLVQWLGLAALFALTAGLAVVRIVGLA